MAALELGNFESIDPRSAWRDEAKDFTPWLANNLDKLCEPLGLELELEGVEVSAGRFTADITAIDQRSGKRVVVENQLETSDHGHLGQLLTYAADFEAEVLIWVARNFEAEHRRALAWLNRHFGSSVQIFAVTVSVSKIGGSRPAPIFQREVVPEEWQPPPIDRSVKTPWVPPRDKRYRPFFRELGGELLEEHRFRELVKTHRFNHWDLETGRRRIWYNLAFLNSSVTRVRLSVGRDKELNNRVHEQLKENLPDFESDSGLKLKVGAPTATEASISCHGEGDIDNPEKAKAWFTETLLRFRSSLMPQIDRLVHELDSKPDQSD